MTKELIYYFAFASLALYGADKKYPVSDIPADLKKDMYAVIRDREERITIKDVSHYTYYSRFVITILNSKAPKFCAHKSISYDKLTKVTTFKGAAYDSEGNLIQKLKSSDIDDYSYVSNYSLFEDTRIKSASLEQIKFPYTVEFEVEEQYNFLYDLPDFVLYDDDEISVQKAAFFISFNKNYPPKFKTFNLPEPLKSNRDGLEVLSWTFEKIIPEKFEPLSGFNISAPHIMVSPTLFEYDGYKGDMSSWENLAKWKSDLLVGRDELPDATRQKIAEATKNLPTNEEKIKAIYEFVQNKTRYVNIRLGIGGLQPFPAKVVDEVGYGDCKGLSNYTIALLKSIGIQGLYATILAGDSEPDVIEDFPSQQSNHVIVAVPNGADTIWLECTDQTKSAGYMGTFTENRKALINTPAGGKLVRTPRYNWDQNVKSRKAQVTLNELGDAVAKIKTRYSGLQSENSGLGEVAFMSSEKQKEWLQYTISIPNFNINSFSVRLKKGRIPDVDVETELSIRNLATVNGKRVFVPGLFKRTIDLPRKIENRKTDVHMGWGYSNLDSVEFEIPENLYSEFLPEPISIKSQFGEYEATYSIIENKLIFTRRVKMWGGTYPPESYNELLEFYKSLNKADNTRVVFLNKT